MKYADNASKLHRDFGDWLIENNLSSLNVRQEVQVKSLCPSHKNALDRFDYYIEGLNVVVELNGKQHYVPTDFGGNKKNKKSNYTVRVIKDVAKAKSANDANIAYVEIAYNENFDTFFDKYEEAIKEIETERKKKKSSSFIDTEENKAYRKEMYRKSKMLKK